MKPSATVIASSRRKPPGKPKSLDEVVRRATEVSTLSQVALRVIEVAKNPGAGAADLCRVVEGDPALSARVLRVANSAAYASRTEIESLNQAISYLGFSQIRNLAITASVSDVFRSDETIGTYQRRALWRHLVSVGVCARLIARRCRLATFEDAFLAGLLHDLGIILLDQHVHPDFEYVIENLNEGATLVENEQEHLGFDHTQLGERVAEEWGFPCKVRAAIRHHHLSCAYQGDGADIVRYVEAANVICTLKGITSVGRKLVTAPTELFHSLEFQREDLLVLAEDLDRELALNEGLIDL